MTLALTTQDLHKTYGKQSALTGLNLQVPTNSAYGFVGVNGAGKTTTFSILAGFTHATSGTYKIDGRLSVLPQDARFYHGRSVQEQLIFLGKLSGLSSKEAAQEVEILLEQVGLTSKAKTSAHKLSHGMYKRLGLAQALLGKPDVLLLDEPTSGLDPETALEMRKLIGTLKNNATVIISSHNLAEISDICTHVGVIHEGSLRYEGPIKELTQESGSVRIHIGSQLLAKDMIALRDIPLAVDLFFDNEKQVLHIIPKDALVSIEQMNAYTLPFLIKAGYGVTGVESGKSLEERFLEIIHSTT